MFSYHYLNTDDGRTFRTIAQEEDKRKYSYIYGPTKADVGSGNRNVGTGNRTRTHFGLYTRRMESLGKAAQGGDGVLCQNADDDNDCRFLAGGD